ncbi:alpha-1,3-mannosyl-glycoprotein 4-beta-N-acetylglucosaminyltransferase B isoform X2 [Callorhinchus milii]|uniref:alpha-1,3-mannosyl-glycoprotein 4-beta-N-acetylglucosaminyltransferase B isoform X2 n=1 Tax=Callorhinchus milii TaxID=7868 RepID=UPI0004574FF0|nr:alpha-1,3-mannosyl-glycoprotein 4-beta-N-acetylglucosaminyltransferase B isoform X2 [Callorhinchus milii]|eukprot:gi/632959835/ref/XP_007895851.1/ PREDICTED: glycosyltransferase 54 domain-containing protein isoform X3 [Callorhinchus milii]
MTGNGDEMSKYQQEFLELSDKLQKAEEENLKRSKELHQVLEVIKTVLASERKSMNITSKIVSGFSDETKVKARNLTRGQNKLQPSIFHHLPHLLTREDSLQPKLLLGQGRTGVSVVIGVPTVKREVQTYLLDTLDSLIYELSPEEKKDCVIIVFIAEVNENYVNSLAENINNVYHNEIESGLLEIISPSPGFYPDLSNLRETFGDTQQRVKWRTKQNLDYSFLMMYAQPKGTFYLQLEDDIIAKNNYLQTIKNFAQQQPSDDWMILEFSQLGFIGKLFKNADLPLIVEFIIMFYKDKPIDWLLDHILWVKVCNPEKDAKHCDRQKANLRIRYKPSLFQHVGTHSSLAGKVQPLKDKDFGKQQLHRGHSNPMAELNTSLKVYQQYNLAKAYQGENFFWAFVPEAGDFIQFKFFQPLKVERYVFRSGNVEHPGDKLFNTTVEVLPANRSVLEKKSLQDFSVKDPKYKITKDGYLKIGSFVNGVAEGEIETSIGKIEAIRLTIQTESPVWVLLSEILIKAAT